MINEGKKTVKKMWKDWFRPLEDHISFVFVCEILVRTV
jgi:ketosteroid isomerase-like protein